MKRDPRKELKVDVEALRLALQKQIQPVKAYLAALEAAKKVRQSTMEQRFTV